MKRIGFSTGALAAGDFRRALKMLSGKNVNAVELSALRQNELAPLVRELDDLDLNRFQYISFHAPSAMEQSYEATALDLLKQVAARQRLDRDAGQTDRGCPMSRVLCETWDSTAPPP